MGITLFQIFENNDSYIGQDAINFEYNLIIIKKIKNDEKGEIYFILKKKFYEIFEEYIGSDEFKEEIRRLNSKHENDDFYLQRYVYLAKTFVQYYLNAQRYKYVFNNILILMTFVGDKEKIIRILLCYQLLNK